MKKFRKVLGLGLIVGLVLAIAGPVLADSYLYYIPITVTEIGGSSKSGIPILVDLSNQSLVTLGYLGENATDTRLKEAGEDRGYSVSNSRFGFLAPNISAYQGKEFTYYTSYSPVNDSFGIVVGPGGYITTPDDASIKLGDNFTTEQRGWVSTTAGSDKNLVYKQAAFRTFVSDTVSENVTSTIYSSPANANLTPNAVGDYTNISNLVGAATHWEAVDDPPATPDEGTTYIWTASTSQQKDAYNLQDGSFNSTDIINSITVYFRFRTTHDATTVYAQPFLRLNSSETSGTEISTNDESWLTRNEVLSRPGGGNWSPSDISDLQVCIGLKTANAAEQPGCTQVYVKVNYSTVAASVTATGVSSGEYTVKTEVAPLVWAPGDILHFTGSTTSGVNCGAIHAAAAKLWVSFWFKLDADFAAGATISQHLWAKRITANGRLSLHLHETYGDIRFVHTSGGAAKFTLVSARKSWTAGGWYHVVASISSANGARLRIDNGTAVTDADVTAAPNGGNFVIGNEYVGYNRGFKGIIANFVCGTDDLTTDEETALYNGTVPGDETNLWYIDESTGTNIIDYGSGSDNGTANVACTWTTANRPCKFAISIGGTTQGGFARPVSVPDNSANWTFLENDVMPYAEYVKVSVDGVEELKYQPNAMIGGTTLPDRTGSNDGTITWGGRFADSGTTTTLVDSELTQADDYWSSYTLKVVETTDNLAPEGESAEIISSGSDNHTLAFGALSVAPEAGDRYEIWDGQTILWASFPEGITVKVGPLTAYTNPVSSAAGLEGPEVAGVPQEPGGLWGGGAGEDLPLYDLFNPVATALGWTPDVLYVTACIIIAIGLGVALLITTGSALAAIAGVGVGMVGGMATGMLPVWILVVYLILGGTWLYVSRSM